MRRSILTLLLILIILPLCAAVYPYDPDIGQVGEGNALVAEALKESFSTEWMERYVAEERRVDFSTLHGATLPSLLPLDSFIMSPVLTREVRVKDRESGMVMTIFLSSGGLIESLSIQSVDE